MEGQRSLDEQQRSPFEWRKNSLVERRRMRNDRKKRKRHQRRRNEEKKWKADVNMDGFSERLRKETKEKERFLYLARKYYLKWRQNKEIITTLQHKAPKQPSTSTLFGMRTKVHVGFCFCLFIVYFFFKNNNSKFTNIPFTDGMPK